MGIVRLLVVGLALLVGLVVLPTIVTITDLFNVGVDTPLYDIVKLLPIFFIGIIVFGALWGTTRGLQD